MMKKILFILLSFFIAGWAKAQSDVDFWFAAPENYHFSYTSAGNRDRPMYLQITSFGFPSQVTISQPASPLFEPIVVSLAANATQTVRLDNRGDSIECKPADSVLNFGLHIVATSPVSVYYEQASPSNPDIFTLKGKNSLGYSFIIPSQMDWSNTIGFGAQQYNSFCIVATQDNTTITITPKQTLVGSHSAGVTFTKTLNKGQAYTGMATSPSAAAHLGGSKVLSDKPIAISVNDDSVLPNGGQPDLLGDQIIPISIFGMSYIIVKGFLNTGTTQDRVYVYGAFPNTTVFRNGNPTPVATISEGDFFSFQLTDPSTLITASQPILIYHCSGFQQQPGAAVLPPTMCTGSEQIAFTRSAITGTPAQFGLILFTKAGNEGYFNLNGNTAAILATDFATVPGTGGEWVATNKNLTNVITVGSANILSNTHGLFHGGIIYGSNSNSCRYGFFSDFASVNLGPDRIICIGDSTLLDAGAGKDSYLWSNGATTSSIWVSDTGTYIVSVAVSSCNIADTVHIAYYPGAPINLGIDISLCEGIDTTFDAGPGFISYTWTPGNIQSQTITTGTAGTYSVTALDIYGCDFTDTVILNIHPLPPGILIKHN